MGLIVGLTGGIGSGKTTVANLFAELGVTIVDADAIAHALTAVGGAALPAIVEAFGADALAASGALDRARMRERVFADADAKARLEAILHPLIGAACMARCRGELDAGAPYVLLVVPLLVESAAYRERVDRLLVVDCAEAKQVARVMARSQLSEAAVRAIMATQASRAERLAAADDVIANDGEARELVAPVAALHALYLKLGGARRPVSG